MGAYRQEGLPTGRQAGHRADLPVKEECFFGESHEDESQSSGFCSHSRPVGVGAAVGHGLRILLLDENRGEHHTEL